MKATKIAEQAAQQEFDSYLGAMHSTASPSVPQCVIEAAQKAYHEAGGKGEIVVRGHGNTTHSICTVTVQRA